MPLAQVCVDCGARSLRAKVVPEGRAVLVTGPGRIGDKLDGASHVALVRLLEELPPASARFARLRRRPPRLPFFVVEHVDDSSAGELCARLREIGFEARIELKASLGPPEVRRKLRAMIPRWGFMAGLAVMQLHNVVLNLLAHRDLHHYAEIMLAIGATAAAAVAAAVARYRHPLVDLVAAPGEKPGLVDLGRWLASLGRREDRRLLGRILDRLQVASGLGAGEAASLLASRADLACRGLAAVGERSRFLEGEPVPRAREGQPLPDGDVAGALNALREAERLRGVMVADLLRTLSRAEEMCARLARASGLDGRAQAGLLARELSDVETQIAADEDIAALLP